MYNNLFMREYFVDFIAGSISGIFGSLVGHPFDTLKVDDCNCSVVYKQKNGNINL